MELFEDAVGRMVRARIKTPSEIERFRSIEEKVQQRLIEKNQAEEDFGDIPDEFRGQRWLYTFKYSQAARTIYPTITFSSYNLA